MLLLVARPRADRALPISPLSHKIAAGFPVPEPQRRTLMGHTASARLRTRSIGLGISLLLVAGSSVMAAPVTVDQVLMDLNDDAKLQQDLNVSSNRFTRIREE